MLNRKQAKEKRRIFPHFSLACLHHPDHLFPEKNKSVIQDFVVMIVSEQPVMKPGSFFDFLQIICQGIMGINCAGAHHGNLTPSGERPKLRTGVPLWADGILAKQDANPALA